MAYNPYLGSFQMPGIASGFDTASVVSKLMEVEMQPLNRAQEKFDTLNYQQKVWMQVDKKLEEFYDFLIEFKLQGNLIPKKAVSSDEKVLTASSSADADNATFYLKVNSLASPTVVVGEVTDSTIKKKSTIGSILEIEDDTQEIKFSISKDGGSTKEITLSSTDTINDLIAKIKGSEADVSAKFDEA
ncbi:MAG: flagellar cap protein FliD N-terminal domain-containing protein, partial [Defluviitoga tunisiensis]